MNTNTNRRGKIARLPLNIRAEVNQRLDDRQPTEIILGWLNQLAPVQKILADQFAGVPVSSQNLSQWRTGGFRDWQRQQDTLALAEQLSRRRGGLEPRKSRHPLTDCLATAMTLELAKALEALEDAELRGTEHWNRLKPLIQQLERLRRGDHQAARLRLNRERHQAGETRLLHLLQEPFRAKDEPPKTAPAPVIQTSVKRDEADSSENVCFPDPDVNPNSSDAISSATVGTPELGQNVPKKSKLNKAQQS